MHPLYYDDPADATLYAPLVVDRQYSFGDAVLASPITTMIGDAAPGDTIAWTTFLPSGTWATWNGTATYAGPTNMTARYALGDVPLFVRPTAVVPMMTQDGADVAAAFPATLAWVAWPGAPAAAYSLYEDDGASDAYQGGDFVRTNVSVAGDSAVARVVMVTIGAASASGALPGGFPPRRGHVVQLRGAGGRAVTTITANGAPVPRTPCGATPGWCVVAAAGHTLAEPEGALVVRAGTFGAFADVVVTVSFA